MDSGAYNIMLNMDANATNVG